MKIVAYDVLLKLRTASIEIWKIISENEINALPKEKLWITLIRCMMFIKVIEAVTPLEFFICVILTSTGCFLFLKIHSISHSFE